MIELTSENGALLKVFPEEGKCQIGYHSLFGFVSQDTLKERLSNRIRHGFKSANTKPLFYFTVEKSKAGEIQIIETENCKADFSSGSWTIESPKGIYRVQNFSEKSTPILSGEKKKDDKSLVISLLVSALIPLTFLFLPKGNEQVALPEIIEQVTVQIKPETQKTVSVNPNLFNKLKPIDSQVQASKRAISQNLGFLGLLGKKDLTKAIGGAPTQLKDASPGAGAGGKEGSGGEYLVGLGEGLKRVTVGNSGVVGLGGVGTKGAGGGQGGYGNSMIGSGEGKGLTQVPLSAGAVLDGGLDRSVVQATIAKYLSQVRACYEQGLQKNSGLGGLVSMAFEINGGGNLNFAKVDKSTLGDQEVEQCISTRMMGWKFPKPRGGVNVKVTYPFLLRSAKS